MQNHDLRQNHDCYDNRSGLRCRALFWIGWIQTPLIMQQQDGCVYFAAYLFIIGEWVYHRKFLS